MTKKNLVLAFSSFFISRDPDRGRLEEYAICYEQLHRVLPDTFSLIFVDNTIANKRDLAMISQRLYKAVDNTPCLFYDNNIGVSNKGLGELDMLAKAFNRLDLSSYDKISYLTGRRFVTCPYVFYRTENCKKKILVGSQHFVNAQSGQVIPLTPNCFEDMYFSMDYDVMVEYVDYAKKNMNPPPGVGSEQILYSFVNSTKYAYEELNHLGFIRNNWERWGSTPNQYTRDLQNYMVC
jgi:hypothetical protein